LRRNPGSRGRPRTRFGRRPSELLRQPLQPSVSIARNQPLFSLGAPLAAMLSLLCGFLVGAERDRARHLMRVIPWSGAGYAAYGIATHLVHPYRILWREKEAYISDVTATFINHKTAAAYFGSCAVVWLLILCERARHHLPPGPLEWRRVPSRLFENTPPGVVVAFAMLFLCLAALFMTVSRAGVVLSLMALVVAFTLYLRRDLPRRAAMAIVLLGTGALALLTLQVLGGGVSARFGDAFDIPVPHRGDRHEFDNIAALARVFAPVRPYGMCSRSSYPAPSIALPGAALSCDTRRPRSAAKSWPVGHWAGWSDGLSRMVSWSASPAPADSTVVNAILAASGAPRESSISLCGELTLAQLAHVLQRCRALVSVDTAPVHLAAGLGTPVVALYGPSRSLALGTAFNCRDRHRSTLPRCRLNLARVRESPVGAGHHAADRRRYRSRRPAATPGACRVCAAGIAKGRCTNDLTFETTRHKCVACVTP
jgi:hypothetical protein